MSLNEIQITGPSLALNCLYFRAKSFKKIFEEIMEEKQQFSIESECPGFHNCEADEDIIRGFFSVIISFEVEQLVDGITAKTLLKRIESCEFIITRDMVFVVGKKSAKRNLSLVLTGLTNYVVAPVEYEFYNMSLFQKRLSMVKSIVLINSKTKEIKRARLTGRIESYTDYGIVEPESHDIESVSGLVDSPLGPLNVNLSRKGTIRFRVKTGFILTIDCVEWVLALCYSPASEPD